MFVSKRKFRPTLESLEARWVPATIRLLGGNLFISNQTGPLTVAATATPGKFSVTDGAKVVTVSGVGSLISITGTNKANSINFNLAGNKFGGNLLINSGNGDDTIAIDGAGGTLGGNLTVLTGNGIDVANVGTITIGGNSTFNLGLGGDNNTFSGDQVGLTGLGTPVVYGGSVNIINADNVFSDVPVNIGGNLSVRAFDGFANSWRMGVNVSGSASFTSIGNTDDLIRLNEDSGVAGNLYVNLNGGDDIYQQGSNIAVSGAFDVGGSATVNLGEGDNSFFLGTSGAGSGGGAIVAGSLTLISGSGNNVYELSDDLVVYGNLLIQAGNGVNDLAATPILATVAGNASFQLGNGNNLITLDAISSIGGQLNVLTGNGDNTLTLEGAQTYLANVRFGNGDDTLVLNNAALILTGFVDGGGGSNTFTLTLGTLAPNLTLVNF